MKNAATASGSAFDHRLVKIGMEAADKRAVIRELAKLLESKNKVRGSFLDAVLARESEFPTGLPTQGTAIAIPHAGAEHCLEPAVAVGITKGPVTFAEMGSPGSMLEVRIVFLISATDPGDHVEWLSRLATAFQDPHFASELLNCEGPRDVCRLLEGAFKSPERGRGRR